MKFANIKVYDLYESAVASRFPHDKGDLDDNFTREVEALKTIKDKTAAKLAAANPGSGHDCWLKGVTVSMNITAPQYWWMQAMRYNFFDIVSSQSKMHRIAELAESSFYNYNSQFIEAIEKYKTGEYDIDELMCFTPM